MARKYVISKVLDGEAQDGIIEFPQNRTLYVDQFTDETPLMTEDNVPFKPKNMKDVFEHYNPTKRVELEDEDGAVVSEEFAFTDLKDFEDEQLIANSKLLSEEQAKIEAYNTIARLMGKSKTMRTALRDDNTRANLREALKSLLTELENADN